MTKLTRLTLIATSGGKLYPIVIPQNYPKDNTGIVEADRVFFVLEEEREFIVQNIPREFEVR